MGYVLAKVMQFAGGYSALCRMRMSAFWNLYTNIAVLEAEADRRMFLAVNHAIGASFSGKDSKYMQMLDKIIGHPIKAAEVQRPGEDKYEAGYRRLRALIGEQK